MNLPQLFELQRFLNHSRNYRKRRIEYRKVVEKIRKWELSLKWGQQMHKKEDKPAQYLFAAVNEDHLFFQQHGIINPHQVCKVQILYDRA